MTTLDGFHTYVALSRSRGRETIRLLRDFHHDLLQKHPSVHIIPENEHLRVLNEFTRPRSEFTHVKQTLEPSVKARETCNAHPYGEKSWASNAMRTHMKWGPGSDPHRIIT
ncbi:hypothetical protein BDN71DRAFT_1428955 [Pleurotus eryngii]|uniref:Uncharacterized protein n=1 Tax=Pleurotus eryngii TaxID=5323 RepID=A0A9P6A3I4_PLEER|nr:hypothetical protein BDN71DRAFT_1428955 [Pleurotus eryngii]